MNDDDILRRALHRPAEPISSYRVLQDLRPTMRRARHRRRVTVGATAALLLLAGGAGVLALTSGPISPTVRTSSDDNGAASSTLPPVTEPVEIENPQVSDDPGPPTSAAMPDPVEAPAVVAPNEDELETPEAPETSQPAQKPGTAAVTSPPVKPGMPTIPAPAPAPAPAPVAPTTQVLNSACGDVVVEIDGRTVHIASIAPLAGYSPRVTTDGPESVEMKFVGTGDSCEVHAELRSSELDVEIQRSDHDD